MTFLSEYLGDNEKEKFLSPVCQKSFKNNNTTQTGASGLFSCILCDYKSSRKFEVNRHMQRRHKDFKLP